MVGSARAATNSCAKKQEVDHPYKILRVTVLRGRDLVVMDRNGKSDPFVKILCCGQKHNTSVARKTLAPVWGGEGAGETHEFELRRQDLGQSLASPQRTAPLTNLLRCEVWDWDRLGNDPMGCCELSKDGVVAMAGSNQWCALQPMKGMDKKFGADGAQLGALQLVCTFISPPRPPLSPSSAHTTPARLVQRWVAGLNPHSTWIRIALDGRAYFVDSSTATHRFRMKFTPRGGPRRTECDGRATLEEPLEGVRENWDPFPNRRFFEQEWAYLCGGNSGHIAAERSAERAKKLLE